MIGCLFGNLIVSHVICGFFVAKSFKFCLIHSLISFIIKKNTLNLYYYLHFHNNEKLIYLIAIFL